MAALLKFCDGLLQGWSKFGLVSGKYGGPGCVQKDVGDARVAVEENWDAAVEALDGRYSVALDGWHQEEVGVFVEMLKRLVRDEPVEGHTSTEAKRAGKGTGLL